MKKHILARGGRRMLMLGLLIIVSVPLAKAKVIRVPKDAPTIDGAVYIADSGDEIIVSPGIYKGPVPCGAKTLNIHSTDPTNWAVVDATIIEGGGQMDNQPVVSLSNTLGTSTTLAGFTIRNGGGSGVIGGTWTSRIEYCHILKNAGGKHWQYTAPRLGPGKPSVPLPTESYSDTRRYGGGIYGCLGTIQNCIIEFNWAEVGGGLDECSGTIQNNLICRNAAVAYGSNGGGGGGLASCGGTIRNNTIVDNTVISTFLYLGGGLAGCGGTIVNNIIWVSRPDLTTEWQNNAVPSYCCIKGWTGGGTGNITSDPLLVNAGFDFPPVVGGLPSRDWRLKLDSPCIDAGKGVGAPAKDFYGTARGKLWRTQGSRGDGSHTDIGAHEFDPGPLTLWFSPGSEPGVAGKQMMLRYALAASTPPGKFPLTLQRGGKALAGLGTLTATTGHAGYDTAGAWMITLPAWLAAGNGYQIMTSGNTGTGGPVIAFQSWTLPFTVKSPSAVAARAWQTYR